MARANRSEKQAIKRCNQLNMPGSNSYRSESISTSSLQQFHAVKEAELV